MSTWRALVLVLAAAQAPAQQPAQQEEPALSPPADAVQDSPRLAALRRDPRSLPRAPRERWPALGASARDPRSWPPGMAAVSQALRARDLPLALAELQRTLEAEPDFPPALYELGVTYFHLQRYGDALVPLVRFLELLPERVGDTRVLGHCYYSLGRYEEAREHYTRVLAAAPANVEALRGLALSQLRLGEQARALELLNQVLGLDPTHADAQAWVAQILYDQEQLEPALAAAVRARELAPQMPRPWFLLARIQSELGHEAEARAAQRKYEFLSASAQEIRGLEARLLLEPGQVALLRRLVELQRALGSVEGTRAALARALAEAPKSFELRQLALESLDAVGDNSGAAEAARILEERFPGEPETWRLLEQHYARIKDLPKQLRAGERYRRLTQR